MTSPSRSFRIACLVMSAYFVFACTVQFNDPDAAWWAGELTMKFFNGAPAFAAEVRSEGDYGQAAEDEMEAKRRDYFAAGTLVVWDVDLLGDDVIRVYRASDPEQPTIYRRGETAEAEPAVPGWQFPVDELFR